MPKAKTTKAKAPSKSKVASKSASRNKITATMRHQIILEKLPAYFLIFCIVAVLLMLLKILNPFLTSIFVGAVLTIAFYPVYRWLVNHLRGLKGFSSFLTILLVVMVLVIPLSIFIVLMVDEGVSTYELVRTQVESGVFDKYLLWQDGGFFFDLKERVALVVDLDSLDIKSNIISMAQNLSDFLVSQLSSIAATISQVVISLMVMLFSMYYFFKDGEQLVDKFGRLSPLPYHYEDELFIKIRDMVKAVVFGVFVTAIAQGIVGGVGFAIAGISSPVFWAAAMAFFSLVPVVGTALIWVPAAILLAVFGNYWMALFLFVWGVLVIGSVDNILRPYLIGGKAHTYPLMTFLVVLGGVMTMGLKGVLVGPLVLILLVSFLHIYEAEYQRVLKK